MGRTSTKVSYFTRLLVAAALTASVMAVVVLASPTQADEFTVTNTADSGAGSLRRAINVANASAGVSDKIDFAPSLSGKTITLASRLPTITDSGGLTIDGGNTNIAVSGEDKVRVFEVASGAKLTLEDLTVANGLAPDDCTDFVCPASPGGGILTFGTLTVKRSTLSDNSAGIGGGIANEGGGTLTVINSTLSGNVAPVGGGGIWNDNGTVRVNKSTLSGNSAGIGAGGGIHNGATLRVNNSTLSGNSGGIDNITFNLNNTLATLRNTIVANSPSGVDCAGPITDFGHNLDSDGSCVNAINSLSGVDPKLGPLADNGGPTPTHALLAGSPALGMGFSSKAKADQRGEERPSHAGCSDIGAFEEQDPQMQPPFLVKDDFYKPLEDTELHSDVLSNDCDSNEKPASVIPSSQGTTHGTLARNADGSFVYNPDADFFGKDPFTYAVPGGEGAPTVGTVEIIVQPVNDAPSFKKGADQSANQGSGEQSVSGWATDMSPGPANESDQSVHFITLIEAEDKRLFADNDVFLGGLPRVTDDGTLIYTPATDAAGTATVGVVAKDNGGTANGGVDESAPQTFEITINPVNAAIP